MKHLKLYEEFGLMYPSRPHNEFNQEYHVGDFYFKVNNGGGSEGTEIGDITLNFNKDGEEVFCEFEVYQPSSGYWGVLCDDEFTAEELGIQLDKNGKVLNDDLVDEILNAYDSGGGDGEWNDMEFVVEDVSPRGVVEEGWLLITIYKDGKEEEVQFELRQEAIGVGHMEDVTLDSDEDEEKLKKLNIEFSEEFKTELCQAYDDYSNFIR
jgi:hypothetical protein